jgi:hypothetical protein
MVDGFIFVRRLFAAIAFHVLEFRLPRGGVRVYFWRAIY